MTSSSLEGVSSPPAPSPTRPECALRTEVCPRRCCGGTGGTSCPRFLTPLRNQRSAANDALPMAPRAETVLSSAIPASVVRYRFATYVPCAVMAAPPEPRRSRHRARMAPMSPTGMPSAAASSASPSGGSTASRRSSRWHDPGSEPKGGPEAGADAWCALAPGSLHRCRAPRRSSRSHCRARCRSLGGPASRVTVRAARGVGAARPPRVAAQSRSILTSTNCAPPAAARPEVGHVAAGHLDQVGAGLADQARRRLVQEVVGAGRVAAGRRGGGHDGRSRGPDRLGGGRRNSSIAAGGPPAAMPGRSARPGPR